MPRTKQSARKRGGRDQPVVKDEPSTSASNSPAASKKRPSAAKPPASCNTAKKARTGKDAPVASEAIGTDKISQRIRTIVDEEDLPARIFKQLEDEFGTTFDHAKSDVKRLIAKAIYDHADAFSTDKTDPSEKSPTTSHADVKQEVKQEKDAQSDDGYKLKPGDGRIYTWVEEGFNEYGFYDAKEVDKIVPLVQALGKKHSIPTNLSPIQIYRQLQEKDLEDDDDWEEIESLIQEARGADGSIEGDGGEAWEEFNEEAAAVGDNCFVEIILSKTKPKKGKVAAIHRESDWMPWKYLVKVVGKAPPHAYFLSEALDEAGGSDEEIEE
ncbi:hypothetical protein HDV00_004026 [Rhizophlyctis rosea]|nr:hypothetical protein HDV00_004026 [Rhizophlyctis rosea]